MVGHFFVMNIGGLQGRALFTSYPNMFSQSCIHVQATLSVTYFINSPSSAAFQIPINMEMQSYSALSLFPIQWDLCRSTVVNLVIHLFLTIAVWSFNWPASKRPIPKTLDSGYTLEIKTTLSGPKRRRTKGFPKRNTVLQKFSRSSKLPDYPQVLSNAKMLLRKRQQNYRPIFFSQTTHCVTP